MEEREGAAEERPDPHEAYGVPRVPRSRTEALGQVKAELQREMARRAGAYGRRLVELAASLEAAEEAFSRGLERVRARAAERFGPEAARWGWGELEARIGALSGAERGRIQAEIEALEAQAALHRSLRAEAASARLKLIIHREAMGFRRHHLVDEKFPPPAALPPVGEAWREAPAEAEKAPR